MGHRVSQNGIIPGVKKCDAIKNYPVPKNVHDVKRFIGITGFFRKFVYNYAEIARPLTALLRSTENPVFVWTVQHTESFEQLKNALCSEPVLCLYDSSKEHEVHTDASAIGLAGILMQNESGTLKPVFYYSRHCNNDETKYHSYELEVLAIVESLERFKVYLIGKFFRIVTDCSAVATTRLSKPLLPRVARWWFKLQEYDFELVHRAGQKIPHADALSRAPNEPAHIVPVVCEDVMRIDVDDDDWLVTMQNQDPKLIEVMNILRNQTQSEQAAQIRSDYVLKKSRLFRMVDGENKWVVPSSVRWRIVKGAHDDRGHFGLDKTIENIRQHFWFPRMRNFVKGYIGACIECVYNKRPGSRTEGRLHVDRVIPVPFRTLHIDHLGPFPRSCRGNTHVLGVSDAFSKYLVVKVVKSTKTQPVIEMLNELTAYFSLPARIVSDRGTAFTSRVFADYCAQNDIQHIQTAVRTPRANGQIERANQLILMFLRTTTDEKNKWDNKLRDFQWTINSQTNETTKITPNGVVFTYGLRDIIQNKLVAWLYDENDSNGVSSPNFDEISDRIENQRQKWKKRFDTKRRAPTVYKKNDLVVIENVPSATDESRKLEPKYRGPYVISRVLDCDRHLVSDLEDIQRNQRPFHSIFTSEKIKPWCSLFPEADDEDSPEADDEDFNREPGRFHAG